MSKFPWRRLCQRKPPDDMKYQSFIAFNCNLETCLIKSLYGRALVFFIEFCLSLKQMKKSGVSRIILYKPSEPNVIDNTMSQFWFNIHRKVINNNQKEEEKTVINWDHYKRWTDLLFQTPICISIIKYCHKFLNLQIKIMILSYFFSKCKLS